MNKFLVYTSNLPEMPKDMSDVINFAKKTPKVYISSVELNSCLSSVKAGDHILTKKGNNLYVIKSLQNGLDNLTEEESNYLEMLKRECGLKNVNITSVSHITKFEDWCKSAKPIIVKSKAKEEKTMNSLSGLSTRIKDMLMPSEAKGIRISTNGELAVETESGYVAINAMNELVSYPSELVLDLPVFVISKPKDQLQVGDVINSGKSYYKVTKIDGDKISAISYTGTGKVIHTIKDFLFNQTFVRVAVSLAGMTGGQMNPMMLYALSEGKSKDSLLPLLMLSQNGGNLGMNPMALLLLGGKEGGECSSIKDLLMMSMMTGGNGLGNLFGTPQAQTVVKPAPKKKSKKKANNKRAKSESVEESTE